MKRVGENVDNSVYGKTKVEVPFLEAVHGTLKEIGRVIISEKADPRWMDPDGCLMKDESSTYYQGFHKTTKVVLEKSREETPYLYTYKRQKIFFRIEWEDEEPMNATCPICGKSAHHTSACPKYGHMAICDAHCESCHFYKKPYGCHTKQGRRRARFSKAAGKLSCGAIPKERTGGAALCGLAKSIQV